MVKSMTLVFARSKTVGASYKMRRTLAALFHVVESRGSGDRPQEIG
jgi:hypothetical protein